MYLYLYLDNIVSLNPYNRSTNIYHLSNPNSTPKTTCMVKPRQRFVAITLCVSPSVCVYVTNLALKVFDQSTSFSRGEGGGGLPLDPGMK